jgi:hypothetical protein
MLFCLASVKIKKELLSRELDQRFTATEKQFCLFYLSRNNTTSKDRKSINQSPIPAKQ